MTFNITTLNIIGQCIATFSVIALNITLKATFSITALSSIKHCIRTLRIMSFGIDIA